jgi:hypothetical protein
MASEAPSFRTRTSMIALGVCPIQTSHCYSYGHLLAINGHKWDYTFHKWGYIYISTYKP